MTLEQGGAQERLVCLEISFGKSDSVKVLREL